MDSVLDGKLMEAQLASSDDALANLMRELGVNPSDPPAGIKRSRAPRATFHRLANWRRVAFVGSLLAASIGVAALWWSSSAPPSMKALSDPAPLTQATPAAPTPITLSSDLAQQLQPMTRDLAALRQAVERLQVRQEQLVRDKKMS